MALLNKDQIFAVDDRKYQEVSVPEWGGEVRLRTLTGAERDKFEHDVNETKNGMSNARAKLISLCAVNETGGRLFTNSQEVIMLGQKASAPLQRLFNAAMKMNGLSQNEVEELAEDFGDAPAGVSTTVSPYPSV